MAKCTYSVSGPKSWMTASIEGLPFLCCILGNKLGVRKLKKYLKRNRNIYKMNVNALSYEKNALQAFLTGH